MIIITTIINDKHTKLVIDFSDEGVELVGETLIVGDEAKALAYAPFFEADLRSNNAELFPAPEMPAEDAFPDEIGGVE